MSTSVSTTVMYVYLRVSTPVCLPPCHPQYVYLCVFTTVCLRPCVYLPVSTSVWLPLFVHLSRVSTGLCLLPCVYFLVSTSLCLPHCVYFHVSTSQCLFSCVYFRVSTSVCLPLCVNFRVSISVCLTCFKCNDIHSPFVLKMFHIIPITLILCCTLQEGNSLLSVSSRNILVLTSNSIFIVL